MKAASVIAIATVLVGSYFAGKVTNTGVVDYEFAEAIDIAGECPCGKYLGDCKTCTAPCMGEYDGGGCSYFKDTLLLTCTNIPHCSASSTWDDFAKQCLWYVVQPSGSVTSPTWNVAPTDESGLSAEIGLACQRADTNGDGQLTDADTECKTMDYGAEVCTTEYDHACWMCDPGYFGASCTACEVCEEGQYEVSPCTQTSNTVCAPCTVCADDEFTSVACTYFTDAVCETCCEECAGNTDTLQCPSGYFAQPEDCSVADGTRCVDGPHCIYGEMFCAQPHLEYILNADGERYQDEPMKDVKNVYTVGHKQTCQPQSECDCTRLPITADVTFHPDMCSEVSYPNYVGDAGTPWANTNCVEDLSCCGDGAARDSVIESTGGQLQQQSGGLSTNAFTPDALINGQFIGEECVTSTTAAAAGAPFSAGTPRKCLKAKTCSLVDGTGAWEGLQVPQVTQYWDTANEQMFGAFGVSVPLPNGNSIPPVGTVMSQTDGMATAPTSVRYLSWEARCDDVRDSLDLPVTEVLEGECLQGAPTCVSDDASHDSIVAQCEPIEHCISVLDSEGNIDHQASKTRCPRDDCSASYCEECEFPYLGPKCQYKGQPSTCGALVTRERRTINPYFSHTQCVEPSSGCDDGVQLDGQDACITDFSSFDGGDMQNVITGGWKTKCNYVFYKQCSFLCDEFPDCTAFEVIDNGDDSDPWGVLGTTDELWRPLSYCYFTSAPTQLSTDWSRNCFANVEAQGDAFMDYTKYLSPWSCNAQVSNTCENKQDFKCTDGNGCLDQCHWSGLITDPSSTSVFSAAVADVLHTPTGDIPNYFGLKDDGSRKKLQNNNNPDWGCNDSDDTTSCNCQVNALYSAVKASMAFKYAQANQGLNPSQVSRTNIRCSSDSDCRTASDEPWQQCLGPVGDQYCTVVGLY